MNITVSITALAVAALAALGRNPATAAATSFEGPATAAHSQDGRAEGDMVPKSSSVSILETEGDLPTDDVIDSPPPSPSSPSGSVQFPAETRGEGEALGWRSLQAPPGSCGNSLCETGEDATTCPADCVTGPFDLETEFCAIGTCWGAEGQMFDVEAKSDITVTSLKFYPYTTTGTVKVFTKQGTWYGFQTNQGAWTEIVSMNETYTSWEPHETTPFRVSIDAKATQAFYVTYSTGGNLLFSANNGGNYSTVSDEDNNLKIFDGTTTNYWTAGGLSTATTWNGVMTYMVEVSGPPWMDNYLEHSQTITRDNAVIVEYKRAKGWNQTSFNIYDIKCGADDKCTCDLDKEVDDQYLTSAEENVVDENDGTETFEERIDLSKATIYESPVWSGDKSNGTLHFCVRADLLSDEVFNGKLLSVSFQEQIIKLNVNLKDNVFALDGGNGVSITLDDVETSDQNFTNVYEVEAYQCEDGYSATTGAVNQNDPLKMCLRPNSTDVRIASFDITSVKHGSNDTEYGSILGVTKSKANTIFVTILDDGDDAGIATKKLEMLIPADMYEEPDYPVKIKGSAELEFVGDDPEVSEAPSLMPSITPVPAPPSSSPVIAPTARRRIQVRMGGGDSSPDAAAEDLEEQQNHQEEGQRLLQAGGESAGTAAMNLEVALAPAADDGAMHDLDKEDVKNSGDERQQGHNPPEESSAASALATASLKVTALVVAVSMALV